MIIEIPKGTSEKKVREILKREAKTAKTKNVENFFGKLPDLEDGMKIQKRVRNEWK